MFAHYLRNVGDILGQYNQKIKHPDMRPMFAHYWHNVGEVLRQYNHKINAQFKHNLYKTCNASSTSEQCTSFLVQRYRENIARKLWIPSLLRKDGLRLLTFFDPHSM